jgi:sigma-B regulation protein RsbU (phosphoserine phosphatase)
MALGMFEEATYTAGRCTLAKDDLLLLYSDGMTEAEDPEGRPLDEEGLRQHVQKNVSAPIDEIGPNLIRAVGQYAQSSKFADDLTVLAVRRV